MTSNKLFLSQTPSPEIKLGYLYVFWVSKLYLSLNVWTSLNLTKLTPFLLNFLNVKSSGKKVHLRNSTPMTPLSGLIVSSFQFSHDLAHAISTLCLKTKEPQLLYPFSSLSAPAGMPSFPVPPRSSILLLSPQISHSSCNFYFTALS